MEGAEEEFNQTFIDTPAILDKYKAAAVISDGKYFMQANFIIRILH